MAFGSASPQNKGGINTYVYSSISFSNPNSTISPSRLSISYFNKVMKITIAPKAVQQNSDYVTYDNNRALTVYIPGYKAEILYSIILDLKKNRNNTVNGWEKKNIYNVAVTTKDGAIKVSDGSEYGLDNTYCISICSNNNQTGQMVELVYETRTNYTGVYNYDMSTNDYKPVNYTDLEIDTFAMTLHEYYKASSYAIAATVADATAYRHEEMNDIIKAIADKNQVTYKSHGSNYNNNGNPIFTSKPNNGTNVSSTSLDINDEYNISAFGDMLEE